ncbi:uncharacterized protein LOC130551065 [Triplophysa rosa]|uniref:uncharacterized protein LOC130551065 n=1 Tax=Triplophysa rosa TaxID=992332 RepID=UPI002545C0EB|nr:uncharacterized protein LOC130551065 [Triplophysa rosa]
MQPRTKDCDTVRVPLPPPSRISKMEPVAHKILPPISKGKDAGNTGSQQSTALPMTNQNGVPVPHPPSGRSFLCRNFGKEQKDNISPHRDTYSTWCKRPVQLPDIWGTHDCDADLDPTDGTSEIADAEAPQRSSEWFAFCKQYKEEKKDKASVHQETFSSWCRQLPKVRRKDGVTDPSDVRFSRLSKLPDIQVEEDHEQEIGKLWGILLEDVRRKQGRKKSPESRHYRDSAVEKDGRIDRAIGICKKLVGHFSHSWKARGALEKAQEEQNLPAHSLIKECQTRWGSRQDDDQQDFRAAEGFNSGPLLRTRWRGI